ncbi:glucose-dependent insulinotropic receptor [Cololabis saira]|uniref:glucose-dependent insulinotropic receptor n=1 Tax=Cololabis saira TaxID=129043 RepID=UPI002AD49EB0|nr:glucose-dependent insulinotropic receptor [Cololabis saira]
MSYLTEQMSTQPPVGMTTVIVDSNRSILPSGLNPQVMGFILSVAACLIISTNLLVAAALLKLLLKRKSQSWCFVLNLSLADITVGVAITGLATEDFGSRVSQSNITAGPLTNAMQTLGFPGRTRCLLRMACLTSTCMASILSMFLITLDRYVAIKMPLRYSLLSGKGTVAGSLLVLWVTSFTTGFLPVMVRRLQTRDAYDGFCAFFSIMDNISNIVLYSTLFFPVLSLFIYMYLDILKIACSHHKKISQVRQASLRNADLEHGHQHYPDHSQHHLQLRNGYWAHVKALRTVAVLVGCFLLLWSPFFVVCIVHILCKSCRLKEVLENYLWLLGLSNSLINPLVYAFWQREVRLQLGTMFSCVTGTSSAAAPPGVAERCQPPAQTQACVSGVVNFEGQMVPLSATTSV